MESSPPIPPTADQSSPPAVTEAPSAEEQATSSDENWVSLLDGHDLTKWVPMHMGSKSEWHRPSLDAEEWVAHNGILACNTTEHGWLKSDRQYTDFVLELEFKLPSQGNSGVFLRSPGEGPLSASSTTIQVIKTSAWPDNPARQTGAIQGLVAPNQSVQKPEGEWNSMRIRCDGSVVQVTMNGTKIIDASIDASVRPRSGFIGFSNWHGQANGTEFRNIRIRELTP
jgi:hypothetical protein